MPLAAFNIAAPLALRLSQPRRVVSAATRVVCSVARPMAVPAWDALRSTIAQPDFVNGPPSATPSKEWESVRLFGQEEADVRVVLYRDHAHWCPYCAKTQLLLEAKKIPYMYKKINMRSYGTKPDWFLKLVPSGLLPAISIDGNFMTESMDIMLKIESTFQSPYPNMIPTDDNDKMQAFHRNVRLERVLMGAWLNALRGPGGSTAIGMKPLSQVLDVVEQSLGEFGGDFFYGDVPSFVDIMFSPMLDRVRPSIKYWRNMEITDGRQNLATWFTAMNAWVPYSNMRSDDWTHVLALPPQIGPVKFGSSRSADSQAIETERAFHVLNDGPERRTERMQAAGALSRNVDLVLPDAVRGANVNNENEQYVDHAFRTIVSVLLDPDQLEALEESVNESIPVSARGQVATAMKFTRGRVCTPRDMSVEAKREFCGALNWLIVALGHKDLMQ